MKTGLLLSGGMDSLILAWWKRPDIAFTLNYDQLAARVEIKASCTVCLELNIPYHVIEIGCRQLGSGDMTGTQTNILVPTSGWWLYRNQMPVTLGVMEVISFDMTHLWPGITKLDGFHKDGSPEFMSVISHLLSLQGGGMMAGTPTIELSTAEFVRLSSISVRLLAWAHSYHESHLARENCRGCNKYMEVLLEAGYNLGRPD